jgi:hypothetical protein
MQQSKHPQFNKKYYFNKEAAWTPKLRKAFRHYLAHEITDDDYTAYVEIFRKHEYGEVPNGSREEQVDFIIANNTLSIVVLALLAAATWAAMRREQNFELYMRSLSARSGPFGFDEYRNIGKWLKRRATYAERVALVHELDPRHPPIPPEGTNGELDIELWLYQYQPEAEELVTAWQSVTAPSDTTNTDSQAGR